MDYYKEYMFGDNIEKLDKKFCKHLESLYRGIKYTIKEEYNFSNVRDCLKPILGGFKHVKSQRRTGYQVYVYENGKVFCGLSRMFFKGKLIAYMDFAIKDNINGVEIPNEMSITYSQYMNIMNSGCRNLLDIYYTVFSNKNIHKDVSDFLAKYKSLNLIMGNIFVVDFFVNLDTLIEKGLCEKVDYKLKEKILYIPNVGVFDLSFMSWDWDSEVVHYKKYDLYGVRVGETRILLSADSSIAVSVEKVYDAQCKDMSLAKRTMLL